MSDNEYAVYLCGPVRSRDDNGQSWREETKDDLFDFEYLDPLSKYSPESLEQWTPDEIVANDLQMIREADALLVRYEGEPTWGTPMEVFYASQMMDIPVSLVWCHDETVSPWAQHHADYISPSVESAKVALEGHFMDDHEPDFAVDVALYDDASEDIDSDEESNFTADQEDDSFMGTQSVHDGHWGKHLGAVGTGSVSPIDTEGTMCSDDSIGNQRMSDGGNCDCDTSYYGSDAEDRSGDQLAAMLACDTAATIAGDRDTHGDAVQNQEHIADAWTWYLTDKLDGELDGADVCAMMNLLKMSRSVVGERDLDHYRDMAGYSAIAAGCLAKRGGPTPADLTEHIDDNRSLTRQIFGGIE